jgi:S1-C subfamily serine protease
MQCGTILKMLVAPTLVGAAMLIGAGQANGDPPADGETEEVSAAQKARRTPLVELVERVAPSVVSITTLKQDSRNRRSIHSGTGFIVQESGYIITNHHVIADSIDNYVELSDGPRRRYRTIAVLPHEDLALIKIEAEDALTSVHLGRSHDLMWGEDVLTIGNPHGLGHTVAPGIISGLNRVRVSTASRTIQTTAAVNRGNSGGPLFNALGEMIGIITLADHDAENVGFAIAVDRLREVFPQMMCPEQRFGLIVGMDVDTMTEPATVAGVANDSPAAAAGVQKGDQIVRAGKIAVHNGLDFYMSLVGYQSGDSLPLELKRNEETVCVSLELKAFTPPAPISPDGLASGIQVAVYVGRWDALPDFDQLKPIGTGTGNKITHAVYPEDPNGKKQKEYYGLKFTGFVKVPADGVYFFYTKSDDGSQLYIGDRLVVDNDLPHPVSQMGGLVRLTAGLHPITVTFFERREKELLEVYYEGPGLAKRQIPPEALFFKPQDPPSQ